MRKINTKFFLILIGTVVALTSAVVAVHRLQAGNIAQALLWQAGQMEKENQPEKAARFLGRYLEFAPDDLEERGHLALILSDRKFATTAKRINRARFVVEQVLAKDPQRHHLRQALVRLYLTGRQFDQAREHIAYLEKYQPGAGETLYLLGEWHDRQGKIDGAVAAYKQSQQVNPSKPETYLRLVELYNQLDFGKARDQRTYTEETNGLVATALQKLPDDASILSLAAQVAQERGDQPAALAYLEGGLKRSPTEPYLYQALARVLTQQNKRPEAMQALRRGAAAVSKDHQFELNWSLANLLLDDNQVDAALKVAADFRETNALSSDYLGARAQMQQGRWFEAARTFEKLQTPFKNMKELSLQLDLYLGACYEQLEEPALQLAAFRRAKDVDSTSLAARRGIAAALWGLGQTDESLAQYQELLTSANAEDASRWRLEYARLLLQRNAGLKNADWGSIEKQLEDVDTKTAAGSGVGVLRAEMLYAQGETAKAEAVLRQETKDSPQRPDAWLTLAAIAVRKGEPKEADALLREAEAKAEDSAEARVTRVRFWVEFRRDQSEAPLRRLEEGLTRFTPQQQARLLQALAEGHVACARPADAERLLRQITQLPPHAKDLRVRLQFLELALQRGDAAAIQKVLGEMKEIEKGTPEPYWSYGEAMRLIDDARHGSRDGLETARQLLHAAGAQRPNWHSVSLARAEIDEMQGRTEQAIDHYRRALEQGNRDPRIRKQIVVLLSQAQRHAEAEDEVRRLQADLGSNPVMQRISVAVSFNGRDYDRAARMLRDLTAAKSANFRDHLWLGQVLAARGQSSAEAEAAFRRAVALGADQPEAWIGLVRYLGSVGEIEKALKDIEVAGRKLDDEARPLALAQCYETIGALDEARRRYIEARTKQPKNVAVTRAAADFFLRAGPLAEAEIAYRLLAERKLSASAEDITRGRRGLAITLARLGQPRQVNEALALVGLALDDKGDLKDAKFADVAEELLAQARVLAIVPGQRLRARAIVLLEDLLSRQTLPLDDQFRLAQLLQAQTRDQAAVRKTRDLLRAVVASAPKSPVYLGAYASVLMQAKDIAATEPVLNQLETLEKERRLAVGALGSVELRVRWLELKGEGTQAVPLLEAYARQEESPGQRTLALAALQGRLGNLKEAIDLCEKVSRTGLLFDEGHAAAVAILRAAKPEGDKADKLAAWQRYEARVETRLRAAIAKDAEYVPTRLHLADLMDLTGRVDEVDKLCRGVLVQEPHNLVALNNLSWLLAQQKGKADEALRLINLAIQKYGPRPELLDTRAVVLLSRGDSAQALADLERVVREAPTSARYFHLSRAYLEAKNAPGAQAALRQANDLGLTVSQLDPAEREVYQRLVAESRKNN